MASLFPRQRLTIAATAGRIVLPPLVILPQTSHIEVRIPRPTTLDPRAFGNADRMQVAIIIEVDGEEFRCDGQVTGGIRVGRGGELPEYTLRYGLPYGFFDVKEGFPVRLGERAKSLYRARVEITSRDGSIDSDIEVLGFDAPAPQVAFHSSVAFDAVTSARETVSDGVLSLSHTSTGSDRGVFVGNGNSGATGGVLSTSVTYGGESMVEMWDALFGSFGGHAGYRFHNQATASQTVTSTVPGTPDEHALGVISMTGVDQTTPVGTPVSATGTTSPATVTVGSVSADDMVVDSMYTLFGGAPSIGADQTQRYAEDLIGSAGDEIYLKGSTQPGSAGGVMSWSNDGTADWGIGAVAFKPAAGGAVQQFLMPQILL